MKRRHSFGRRSTLVGRTKVEPMRLVVGLNQVDGIVHDGWDSRLNLPTPEAERQIERKCSDLVHRLAKETGIDRGHIEYYSALKRYRLHHLLIRVIANCPSGFRFGDVEPKHFEDVEGVDESVRRFTKEERERRAQRRFAGRATGVTEVLLTELGRLLDDEEMSEVRAKFDSEMRRTPKVAVLGQSGVGKTTTVNALFATNWATSDIEVGTTEAQSRTVELRSGGSIEVVDLPGYGRSIEEDADYLEQYRELLPSCDLVLLIVQANRGDFEDDQAMLRLVSRWMRQPQIPTTTR